MYLKFQNYFYKTTGTELNNVLSSGKKKKFREITKSLFFYPIERTYFYSKHKTVVVKV